MSTGSLLLETNTSLMDNINNFFRNRTIVILSSITLGVLSIFIIAQTVVILHGTFMSTNASANTITVSGKGTATSTPNVITVSYSVSSIAKTVATAQDEATKIGNAAIDFLQKDNIADTDIKTTSYIITPNYERVACVIGVTCPSQKLSGYKVSQNVSVKIIDIKKIGMVLQGLGQTGITNLYAGSPQVANPTTYENLARTHAIAKAKANAIMLSNQLGVHLGRLVRFSEFGNQPRPLYARTEALSSTFKPPTFPTGKNTYTSNVTLVYAIY